ncbi:Cysteine desulfurase [Halanaerobium saccharolyticum subsp. saccharolyticum DSM 6643]|uniref:cysteine desulfurase n=1 Tax=Halanaerobium saccharolyticum subsp. saccharolyticum DSM 6643 TaxID=1293054 RepID=M5E1E1_9FIRM|nr:aminotransferase class V-fold PLP-dependent enzyme [Halanaerobium saccharolyticum]CCU79692.1 Cysteine desulfurase [Halanaerobium saccharolyticum subsp. saccharolyticum DSM 6643]
MDKIYLDNAATSRDKAAVVKKAILNYYDNIGCSPGRGGYEDSLKAGRIIIEARNTIADFFNVDNIKQIIFTHNITYALNIGIKGILKKGDHVITSTMEHNSVLRPLNRLEKNGIIDVDYIQCDQKGRLNPAKVKAAINKKTKLIILTYASNVSGTIMPVQEVGEIAAKNNVYFMLDTAQAAGVYGIDFKKLKVDFLAFTGHKALMGPTGTGGFAISKKMAAEMEPLIEGGTGSKSDQETQPNFLPDKFESGTMNTMGISGLKAGVEFIQKIGIEKIREHEHKLGKLFLEGLKKIPEIKIIGPANLKEQVPTFSITAGDRDLGQLSFELDEKYNVMTRSGLHCAPFAHKTLGTFPAGSLRFSIGYFNTIEEIEFALNALKNIL